MKWQKPAFIISAIVLVIGLASGFARKDGVFGVDFAGGDSMLYSFQQKVAVEELRSAVGALEVGDAKITPQTGLWHPGRDSGSDYGL